MRSNADIENTMKAHGDAVWRACLLRMGSRADAQDMLQETFLAYATHDTVVFNDEEHRKAWLIRVATNRCIDTLRARAPQAEGAEDALALQPAVELSEQPEAALWEVAEALDQLPGEQREALYRRGGLISDASARQHGVLVGRPGKKAPEGGAVVTERDAVEQSLERLLANETMPQDAVERTLALVEQARSAQKPPRPLKLPRRRFVQLMAACLAVGALGTGGLALAAETAQIEIDGAATVELGVNRWGNVVRVACADPSAASAIDGLDLMGKSCSEALCALADDAGARQAVSGGSAVSIVAVCGGDAKRDELLGDCESAAAAFGRGSTCSAVSDEVRQQARDADMGMARYQVFLQLNALDPSLTVEECRAMPMRELRQLLSELEGGHDGSSGAMGQGHGRGQHVGQGAGPKQEQGWRHGQASSSSAPS